MPGVGLWVALSVAILQGVGFAYALPSRKCTPPRFGTVLQGWERTRGSDGESCCPQPASMRIRGGGGGGGRDADGNFEPPHDAFKKFDTSVSGIFPPPSSLFPPPFPSHHLSLDASFPPCSPRRQTPRLADGSLSPLVFTCFLTIGRMRSALLTTSPKAHQSREASPHSFHQPGRGLLTTYPLSPLLLCAEAQDLFRPQVFPAAPHTIM